MRAGWLVVAQDGLTAAAVRLGGAAACRILPIVPS